MSSFEQKIKLLKDIFDTNPDLINAGELTSLLNLIQKKSYFNSNIPRVLLIGQFKSGKSSLLNALFGKYVSVSDIFEMTAWNAVYYPSENEFVDITFTDCSHCNMNLNEFINITASRKLSSYFAKGIDMIEIGIQSSLECSFIDVPGFGSQNTENESIMLNAIKESDYIFFTISSETIGTQKEHILIKYLQEINLPMSIIVTKSDLINNRSDKEEIAEWISINYGIKANNIIFASSKTTDGINVIKKLISQISIKEKDIRTQAQSAYNKMVYDRYLSIADDVSNKMSHSLILYDSAIEDIKRKDQLISQILPNELLKYTKNNLFRERRSVFVSSCYKAKSKDEIDKIIKSTFNDEAYIKSFVVLLNDQSNTKIQEYWDISNTKKMQADTKADDSHDSQNFSNESQFPTKVVEKYPSIDDLINDEDFSESLKKIISTAGILSMICASLPAVSIIGAISGIGIPLTVVGVIISAINKLSTKIGSETVFDGDLIFDNCINQIIKKLNPTINEISKKNITAVSSAMRSLSCERLLHCERNIFVSIYDVLSKDIVSVKRQMTDLNTSNHLALMEGHIDTNTTKNTNYIDQTSEDEIYTNSVDIRNRFIALISMAKKYIIIHSAWIKNGAIDDTLIEIFQSAIDRGVNIYIMYGIDKNIENESSNASAINKLSSLYNDTYHTKTYVIWTGNDHRKIVIIDGIILMRGSFNFLSYNPNINHDGMIREEESSVHYSEKYLSKYNRLYSTKLVNALAKKIANSYYLECMMNIYKNNINEKANSFLVNFFNNASKEDLNKSLEYIKQLDLFNSDFARAALNRIVKLQCAESYCDFIREFATVDKLFVQYTLKDNYYNIVYDR